MSEIDTMVTAAIEADVGDIGRDENELSPEAIEIVLRLAIAGRGVFMGFTTEPTMFGEIAAGYAQIEAELRAWPGWAEACAALDAAARRGMQELEDQKKGRR